MSPFLIQKSIQGIVGTPKSVKKLKSGALLIEVMKKQHSTSLLFETIGKYPFDWERPQCTKPKLGHSV